MIRTRRAGKSGTISGINITPFTDVCLVLLIIFLVTAHTFARESSLRLNLPRAASAKTPLPTSVTVKIDREGHLYVADRPVTPQALGQALTDARVRAGVELLVVRADEGVAYRQVIAAIDTARKVGYEQIALATRQPEPDTR